MKNKKFLFAVIAAFLLIVFCGCANSGESDEETNPEEFSYDMLDISLVSDEIYEKLGISDLTRKSVLKAEDKTFLEEQFYLDLKNVVSYDIRYAEGSYGAADVAIIRVKEGKAEEVMESLENRKDDRISEFRNYDVYDSFDIAMEAEIYKEGELVIMLMLSEDDKTAAKETISYYLP
ncbi:MAG: DUF4358 domain-containing protein [Oscillospiraceae bacterium]|nr:DUF4358 domain-containing protein [Oscillospiraceae bacterium]